MSDSPCTSCSACCASYRVDFSIYQLESLVATVPGYAMG